MVHLRLFFLSFMKFSENRRPQFLKEKKEDNMRMTSFFFACENLKSHNLTFHKIWQIFSWLPLFCILFKFQVGSGDDLHKLGLFSHCRMSRQIYNIPSFSVPFTQYSKLEIWKYIFDCLIKLHFVSGHPHILKKEISAYGKNRQNETNIL